MLRAEEIAFAVHKAQHRFLVANPKYSSELLKGRNHLRRTVLATNFVSIIVGKNTKPEMSAQLSAGLYQGYCTIYPTDFIEILSEELQLPIAMLVNNVNV